MAYELQVGDGEIPLPVETAIGFLDSKIYDRVQNYLDNGGVGELCGLWNSKKVKGKGVSMILIRAAISIINQLKFKTLTGICADYSMSMFEKVGFVPDLTPRVKMGTFTYPNSNYVARVVGILDAETLKTALEFDRKKMLTLRKTPVIEIKDEGEDGDLNIVYDLLVPNVTKNQTLYTGEC